MAANRSLKKLFLLAMAPQLLVCIAYWAFGISRSGSENAFEAALTYVYLPAKYITALAGIILFGGWAGVGFTSLIFPLVGAALYSLVFAAAVRAHQAGHLRAFFSLFGGGQ